MVHHDLDIHFESQQNVVHHDLDIHFESQQNVVHHDLDIHKMWYIMTLTYIFNVANFEIWMSGKLWSSAICFRLTFIKFDICYRMGPLRNIPLLRPSFWRSYILMFCFLYKNCVSSGHPRQICLDSHDTRCCVALVYRPIQIFGESKDNTFCWWPNVSKSNTSYHDIIINLDFNYYYLWKINISI